MIVVGGLPRTLPPIYMGKQRDLVHNKLHSFAVLFLDQEIKVEGHCGGMGAGRVLLR